MGWVWDIWNKTGYMARGKRCNDSEKEGEKENGEKRKRKEKENPGFLPVCCKSSLWNNADQVFGSPEASSV